MLHKRIDIVQPQAAKEFESELKKDPEPSGDSPAEIKSVGNEEEDSKLSSIKES